MDNDWASKFKDRQEGVPAVSALARTDVVKVAGGYWIAVLLVFFIMQGAGFDMIGDGAIPIAALTAPWSVLVIAATSSLSSRALLQPFISPFGTFVIFPVICGGLNAVVIFAVCSAVHRDAMAVSKLPPDRLNPQIRKLPGGVQDGPTEPPLESGEMVDTPPHR